MRSTTISLTPAATRPDSSLSTEPSGPGHALLALRLRAQAPEPQQLGVDPEPHQPVADGRRSGRRHRFHAATAPAIGPEPRGATSLPIETRSFINVALATRQPSPTSPTRMASGTRGVGEEHLVEAGRAGHAADRADLHAGLVHVDDERGEALVLRRVGVGAGEQQPEARLVRHRRPDLLSRSPPTRRRRARRGSRARRRRSRRPAR